MKTNTTAFAACNTAASQESCLVNTLSALKGQRAQVGAYLQELAAQNVIDTKAAGFATLLSGIQGLTDLFSVSRELVKSYSL